MIEYQFTLNGIEASEPRGWSEVVLGVLRDEEKHGVTFQATISNLGFYGPDAEYLTEQKRLYGLRATVIFRATQTCQPGEEPEEVLVGRLNFGRYSRTCGTECIVSMPVEQQGCAITLLNRYDQRVDLDSLQAFDRFTPLQGYTRAGFPMQIAARNIEVGTVGEVRDINNIVIDQMPVSGGIMVRPTYFPQDESLNQSQLQGVNEFGDFSVPDQGYVGNAITPFLLLDENPDCFNDTFQVDIRLKGNYDFKVPSNGGPILITEAIIFEVDDPTLTVGVGSPFTSPNYRIIARQNLPAGGHQATGSFDLSFTDPALTLTQGRGLYAVVRIISLLTVSASNQAGIAPVDATVNWDPETHVSVLTNKSCPPTDANVFMVNEVLSRIVESVTNNCMRVKSDYYGRVDSQPYESAEDGCGSLRVLTSGLKLRNAEKPGFFLSMQEAFNGLRGIDNIGFGIEPDPNIPGYDWVRIEPVEYFYQNVEILELPYVPNARQEVDESKHYSLIKVGYTKWETQDTFGLDEFNSNREYRTSLETVRNPLDIQSNFVAGSYPTELTRQQNFVATAEADTAYDNETFIICVEREAYGFKVEQGIITSPANVYSPETAYNWRITPLRNLMRWFKSIANSYANLADSAAKLFFSSGTGNYTAEGQLIDDCALENAVLPENKDLSANDFKNKEDYLPLIRPEFITISSYPLALAQYKKIRSNPYGYISVQCGKGEQSWLKGYIIELNYQPSEGQANFKLRLKWE